MKTLAYSLKGEDLNVPALQPILESKFSTDEFRATHFKDKKFIILGYFTDHAAANLPNYLTELSETLQKVHTFKVYFFCTFYKKATFIIIEGNKKGFGRYRLVIPADSLQQAKEVIAKTQIENTEAEGLPYYFLFIPSKSFPLTIMGNNLKNYILNWWVKQKAYWSLILVYKTALRCQKWGEFNEEAILMDQLYDAIASFKKIPELKSVANKIQAKINAIDEVQNV